MIHLLITCPTSHDPAEIGPGCGSLVDGIFDLLLWHRLTILFHGNLSGTGPPTIVTIPSGGLSQIFNLLLDLFFVTHVLLKISHE